MLREEPGFWDKKPVDDFFLEYRPEITELLKSLPKVVIDGVLLPRGIEPGNMPYLKELIQAKIMEVIHGRTVTLFPRSTSSILNKYFGVNLRNGSVPDSFLAITDAGEYIELKVTDEGKFTKRLGQSAKTADMGFIAVSRFTSRMKDGLLSGKSQVVLPEGFKAYILDLESGEFYLLEQKKEERLISDPLEVVPAFATSRKASSPNIPDASMLPSYVRELNDVNNRNKNEVIDYDNTYKVAPETDQLYQMGGNGESQTLFQGYFGYSMSNNAAAAYADGEKPMSKWT